MSVDGEVNQVSVMVGCQSDEGRYTVIPTFLGLEGYEKPVLNRTIADGAISMYIKNADAVALDTISAVYIDPDEVSGHTLNKYAFHIMRLS